MEDYRERHHKQYLEREKDRQRVEQLEKFVKEIQVETSIMGVYKIINSTRDIIKETIDKQKLSQIGLDLIEAINTNPHISIDFNNTIHVTASQEVQKTVKEILGLCGLDDTLEVQYNMDCSRDEEIARQLSAQPPVVRRRGRPRKVLT
jgi:hypothetical protein